MVNAEILMPRAFPRKQINGFDRSGKNKFAFPQVCKYFPEIMKISLKDFRHIVWDWNGTLLDDLWLCMASLDRLLARVGKPNIDVATYQRIFSFPVIDVYRDLGFDTSQTAFEAMSREFMDYYEENRLECTLQKGARKFIHRVHTLGMTQSVLSAYRHDYLTSIIADHDLEKYFVHLSGNDDIYASDKSYRAPGHLKKLGIPAEFVLYIGDTLHDVETARAMGVQCVLIDQGERAHQSRERLLASGVPVIRDYAELL